MHPPQHHSLLQPSVLPPPHLNSSSLGLADQFPLDIDYCYNCTILITCPLESLSLSVSTFSHCSPLSLLISLSAGLFLSRPLYLSHENITRDYNPSIVCARQEVMSDVFPLCGPWGHKSSNGLVLYIFYYLLISIIYMRCSRRALRANLCLHIFLCTHV